MLEYIIQFWEIALTAFLVLLELITRWADKDRKTKHEFSYTKMPALRPVKIPTVGKGILRGIWVWIAKSRTWELTEDFHYTIDGVEYIIPAGFVCDATSIPKFLRTILSPTGILLLGGLVHDYGYRYTTLHKADGTDTEKLGQKDLDKIFRDINIQVNGFKAINYVPYYMLRLFGWYAWGQRRKEDKKRGS